jgi:UDP-N-acetylglucosamine 2-epimerase (non-hydrolysing)
MRKKTFLVCGARPNFMKIAPIMRAMARYPEDFEPILVHTGQHYDENMSKVFFEELGLPEPDYYLGVGSGHQGEQTARVMIEFEKLCLESKPDLVVVVGDVNSTLAAALVAAKLHIRVAHVEAGLRSFDPAMPEEVNRVLTDMISNYLFTPSPDADENLVKSGVSKQKIYMVGDIMVDSLLFSRKRAADMDFFAALGLSSQKYAVLTLHRPSNVDHEENLKRIFSALEVISKDIPIIFPVHPRTRKNMLKIGIDGIPGMKMVLPLGYLEFLNLMMNCCFMLTDSGGIQEETTVLGIPCLTLRNTTERPITLTQGTNILVWNDTQKIIHEAMKILKGEGKDGRRPDLWDGKTAERIVGILAR